VEVVMARQPEVFVRPLEPAEAQRLVKITRTARDRVRLRRAGIVLASVQGRSAADAAAMFAATTQYAREVIHAFNELGFAALDPKWSGADPVGSPPAVREIVCRVARAELLRRSGNGPAARAAYRRALDLATTGPERRFLT
jgi:hypothetical protein